HEILSRDTVDQVHFNDILPSLVRMAEDLVTADHPVRITSGGEAGNVPASVATPLAVVVTELLQNAIEHAYPDEAPPPPDGLQVDIRLQRTGAELRLTVQDNGIGLPPGFTIEDSKSLGLSIVRSLVGSQLGGTISMRTEGGTVVELRLPLDQVDDDLDSL
ncbi:MAG TPA: sensor histidine kinase, partial [Acidimicrobiales bacterium]|nr:sensor histidine kinase [Acidimicrobiales bacterium]